MSRIKTSSPIRKAVDVFYRIFRNPVIGCLATVALTDIREVFAGNTQFRTVVFQFPWFYFHGSQQVDELLEEQTASRHVERFPLRSNLLDDAQQTEQEGTDQTAHNLLLVLGICFYQLLSQQGMILLESLHARLINMNDRLVLQVERDIYHITDMQHTAGYLRRETDRLLSHSDMSIKEICAYLDFPNLSFFGKYVKAHLGYSPTEYRRLKGRHENGANSLDYPRNNGNLS